MNFINNFHDFCHIANSPEDAVLRVWQGLGYYSRARNMMKAAEIVCQKHGGKLPADFEEIIALPGIGQYTASAIASFAFGLPYPAVDGNVRRVGSRFLGLTDVLGSKQSDKTITEYLKNHITQTEPGTFNQAMIEIGASVCTPQKPDCFQCPLAAECVAFHKGLQQTLPITAKKRAPTNAYLDYLWIEAEGHTWIQKRDNKSIWKGLYEFPAQQNSGTNSAKFPFSDWLKNDGKAEIKAVNEFKHQLTHRTIYARLWHLSTSLNNIVSKKEYIKITSESLQTYPLHRLMLKFLDKNANTKNND